MRPAVPTPPSERIVALDVLRGFALLGVLAANLPSFARTSDAAYAPPGGPPADVAAWFVLTALVLTKFVALFSILFGAGLALQRDRARAAGRAFERPYLRRLGVLAVLGLLHGTLLFPGDILFIYSLAGLALFLLRDARPRTCLVLAGLLFAVGAALSVVVITAEEPPAPPPGPALAWGPGEDVTLEQLWTADFEADWPALERKAYGEGPWRSTLLMNTAGYALWLFVSSLISFNWRVLAWFLVGAALVRLDFFAARRRSWQLCCAWIAGPAGLALEVFSTARRLAAGSADGDAVAILATEVGATLLALGYLGGVTLFAASDLLPRLRAGLAAAGRTALSQYVGQSVVACLLFRWYGLGLYGRLANAELLALALVVFTLQVAAASLWLRRHRSGPLEAVWRRLTYGAAR